MLQATITLNRDMPKTCSQCKFSLCFGRSNTCVLTGELLFNIQNERDCKCPLKEVEKVM